MDQYSFYLALKHRYPNVIYKFELYNLTPPQHNGQELERVFGIKLPLATAKEVATLSEYYPITGKFRRLFSLLYSVRRYVWGPKSSHIRLEDSSAFYPEVFELSSLKSYLFTSNWGNEKYREGIEEEIQEAFTFRSIEDDQNRKFKSEIESTNSISLHVRHGDYVKYNFPILPLDYYKRAYELIKRKIEKPKFFVFSDDKDYIKRNFSFLGDYTVVDCNSGENSFRDMQLMSLCKHNIIANSTFSYWGAVLNKNREKIVIAPSHHVSTTKNPIAKSSWLLIDF